MAMAEPGGGGPSSPAFTGDPFSVFSFDPSEATAGIDIESGGNIGAFDEDGALPDIGTWDGGGSFVKADFDFRADKISGIGSLNSPNLQGIWYPGSGSIQFKVITTSVKNWVGTLRMRPTGGGADIDTASLQLEADST
jgi:hypothetical protein